VLCPARAAGAVLVAVGGRAVRVGV